jgi:two-component system KDP operon response regulator KdpE
MPIPENVLLVDDEPHVLVLLRALVKQLGVQTVWEAADGAEALEQAAAHRPQVVLLDLNLPQIDGLHVLEKLKADYPKMPVIVVSAQSTQKTFLRARELGAEGYVLKYAPKPELLRMLSEALERLGEGPGEAKEPAAAKPT